MEIILSDVVLSMAGHDKGKAFYVVGVEPGCVFLANGKTGRTVQSPKKKKLMHVQFLSRGEGQSAHKLSSGEAVSDSQLRRDLAIMRDRMKNQGG